MICAGNLVEKLSFGGERDGRGGVGGYVKPVAVMMRGV